MWLPLPLPCFDGVKIYEEDVIYAEERPEELGVVSELGWGSDEDEDEERDVHTHSKQRPCCCCLAHDCVVMVQVPADHVRVNWLSRPETNEPANILRVLDRSYPSLCH